MKDLDTLHMVLALVGSAFGLLAAILRVKHARAAALLNAVVTGVEAAGRTGDAKAAVEAVAKDRGLQDDIDYVVESLFPTTQGSPAGKP